MSKTNMQETFLFASDIDATLLDSNEKIPRSNLRELVTLSKNPSFNLMLITGRAYAELGHILPQLPKEIRSYYLGTSNGALLVHVNGDDMQEIKETPFNDQELVFECCSKALGEWFNVYTKFDEYTRKKDFSRLNSSQSYKDIVKEKIYKIVGTAKRGYRETNEYKKLMKLVSNKVLTIYSYGYETPYVEVTAYKARKVNTVKVLQNKLNIDSDQIIVVGDGKNDIEMLNAFNNSFLMANSPYFSEVDKNRVTRLKSDNNNGMIQEVINLLLD